MFENFKINEKSIKKIIPYVLGSFLACESCSMLGFTPFHLTSEERMIDIREEITNNNYSSTFIVDDASGINDIVCGYSKWEKKDDGYIRSVDIYNDFNDDVLLDRIVSQESIDLKEELGKPDITTYEQVNYLSDDELLNNDNFVKVIMYREDAYQMTEKESIFDEVAEDIDTALLFSLGLGIPYVSQKLKDKKSKKLSRK